MKIIGLTGFAKSGKSTAAEILKSLGGQEVAFAKHLKDVCSAVFGVERSHFDDQAFKEIPFDKEIVIQKWDLSEILEMFEIDKRFLATSILAHRGKHMTSPRHVAQYIGTEVLRSIDENIHIKMAFKLNADSTAKFLICSDVRFDNELKAVQEAGGTMFGIWREAIVPKDLKNLHPSEKEIPSLVKRSDLVFHNESTIEKFQIDVENEAKTYLMRHK